MEEFNEGDICPECNIGELYYPPAENCTCHLGHPPCPACLGVFLTCPECGWEWEE